MSGIDEGIPLCPECQMESGASESPSYWIGYHKDGGKIWLISDRFKEESTQYANTGLIFTTGFDSTDSKYIKGILNIECGWSSQDRRGILGGRGSPMHVIRERDSLHAILMRAYRYTFNRHGGCFVK